MSLTKAIESGKEHRIQYGEKGTSYAKKLIQLVEITEPVYIV